MVTVGDLKLMLGIIAVSSQRGSVWGAEDLSRVGALHDKLLTIVTAIEKQVKEAEEGAAAEAQSGVIAEDK